MASSPPDSTPADDVASSDGEAEERTTRERSPRRESPSFLAAGDDASTVAPTVALRDADTHRAVRGYAGASLVCLVGAAGLFLAPQANATLRWVTTSVACLAGLYTGWLAVDRWRGGLYSDREAQAALVLMALAGLCAVAYAGPMSAPAVVLVILVTALAMGNEPRGRLVFFVLSVGYLVITILALARVIPPQIAPAALRSNATIIVVAAVVELVLVVSYWFGLSARRSTQDALLSVQQARLALAGREALLQEARADLERVVKGAGRLTGQRIDDFVLGEVIGRGAMGEVYAARSPRFEHSVALKILHHNLITDGQVVKRFFREAQICRELSSPHVVRVLGFGEAGDGSPYLAMERIEGRTLGALLRFHGALELDEVNELLRQVCAGIEAAHAAGVVHRDVKPSNIMLLEGEPCLYKVVDFGISKLLGSGTLTGDGMVGTPGYMAPEQAHGDDVDERADVFALGAVAYRALTGVPAFAGKDAMAVVLSAAQRQPPAPGTLVDLPEQVEQVLALALAKDRGARLGSAAELAEAFARACAGRLPDALQRRARAHLSRMPWTDALSVASAVEGSDRGTPSV